MLVATISQQANALWQWIKIHNYYVVVSVGQSLIISAQPADSWKLLGSGAIVYNRVRVLDGPSERGTREKENKIRHRLAEVKAARTV